MASDKPTGDSVSFLSRQPDAAREALRNAQQMLPLMIDFVQLEAKVTRAKYLALVNEGFDKEEALFLCKSVPSK